MSATNRPNFPLRGIGAPLIAAVLVGLITSQAFTPAISPANAQASGCDCSCESYTKLRQIMEEFEAQQDSEMPQRVPPEMMQMSMCAGQCAMQWAQCENPDVDFSGMQESQKRALQQALQQPRQGGGDYSGDNAIARERAINERSIGETEKNLQADANTLPKNQLSGDYLKGTWCSVYGGQETTQWEFTETGDYRIGVPAGRGYAMQPGVNDLGHFKNRFETLLERDSDTFTTLHEHGRKNVYSRGACR